MRDDPDGGDWEAPPYVPGPSAPTVAPEGRSPYAPSLGTKVAATLASFVIVVGGLGYLLRYQLGFAHGTYAFVAVQPGSGEPVTYPSCQTITYVVNDQNSVEGGRQLIDEAVGKVSAATGLRFASLGATELPAGQSAATGATVLITWTDDTVVPMLAGDTVGAGGSRWTVQGDSGLRYFVSGEISLDAPDLAATLEVRGSDSVRAVIMHELGHVVGLDHVDDSSELMNATNIGMTDFGPGDLVGLKRLGEGGC
jgi:hypothetical protein